VEGGEKNKMKYLEDLYMESVFPLNYNLPIREDLENSMEDGILKLKNIFIRIHKGLLKLKKADIYPDVCDIILNYLKPVREHLKINLRKDVEDEIKEYLKSATPQQIAIDINIALSIYNTGLPILYHNYELENNEKMLDILKSVENQTVSAHANFESIANALGIFSNK
jgi:hypothetical protein